MKHIKIYLIIFSVLFACCKPLVCDGIATPQTTQTIESQIQIPETAPAINSEYLNPEIKEFETLVHEALIAQKPSLVGRFIIDLAKELCLYLPSYYYDKKISCTQNNSLMDAIAGLFTIFSNLAIYEPNIMPLFVQNLVGPLADEEDQTLISLQKLLKFISGLAVEQKAGISNLFNKEYVSRLKNKILNEKDGIGIRLGRECKNYGKMIICLCTVIMLAHSIVLENKNQDEHPPIKMIAFTLSLSVLQLIILYRHAKYTTDYKKKLLLKEIERALILVK